MKHHTKIYMDYFGFTIADFIPCEICGKQAVDTAHIDARGMGGSKSKDVIENLMAKCRKHHDEYGDKKQFKEWLKTGHLEYMRTRTILKNQ